MPYDNELKFALFKNDKGDNQSRPDYRGTVTIKGVEYTLSGWISEVKSGKNAGQKYIRGQAQVKQGATNAPAAQLPAPANTQPQKPTENLDEDVPF